MSDFNNIGIDGKLDWERIAKLFRIGLFAGIIVFISDWILGYGLADESLTGIEYMLSKYVGCSDTTLFWSALLGLVGIMLEGLSYFGIYRLMAEKSPEHAHLYRTGIIGYLVFGPAGVHVPCVALVYIYNQIRQIDSANALAVTCKYATYFVLPATVLFSIFYIILCYAQISAFIKEMTPYPKWCFVFSLPFGMAMAACTKLFGNHAVLNAIQTAWISVGNIWMFGGLLLMMKRAKMQKVYFDVEKDGFFGAYFPLKGSGDKAMILMLGDDIDDRMVMAGVKWAHRLGCNVMTMAPDKKDYGHHSYPLERFEKAITYLKNKNNHKIGIAGASTTGMLALVAASYFSDITLTLALSPADFVMEGFYRDGLDGARERPGDYESSVSYGGKQLPFLPYAYRHPLYWEMIQKESKEGKDMIACRKLFEESEKLHPVMEEEKIKVENIKGKVVFVGAEDDVLWNTCKYIRRMEARLEEKPHECEYEALIYEHGTHFVFPQKMLEYMIPLISGLLIRFAFRAGKEYPKECKQTRIDIDKRLSEVIMNW